ncbi:MAG: hypothetical protein Crog4KO_08110 [Crocinitomicaceae bacterium]
MDNKKFDMAMTILKYGIGIIGIIAVGLVLSASPKGEQAELELVQKQFADSGQMGFATNYTIFIIGAALLGVLLFFVYQLITNFKKTAMSIIGVVAALVLYLVLRVMGTSDTNQTLDLTGDYVTKDSTIAATTAGLWLVIIGLMVGALLAILGPFILGKYRK